MRASGRTAAILILPALLVGVLAAPQPPQSDQASQLLHPLLQDHAVLQRARPINVYGETVPGVAVAVTLGSATAETRADANGHWSARLPALATGGPYTLTASANGETRTAKDILVGDVFFCSGQSNMAFSQRQAQGAADDARTTTDADIRHFNVPAAASLTPQRTFAGSPHWIVGSPETVGGFSAVCYYFARGLKKTVNVPIGLVTAAYGGARLRNFTSEETLRQLALESEDLDILDLYRNDPMTAMRRWGKRWESWWTAARPKEGRPWMADYDDTPWRTAPPALGPWALWTGINPDGFIGQMWMRTTVTLTPEQAAKAGADTFRGAVWYQGESDVHFPGSYYKSTLLGMMAERRRQFADPDLPFLLVQLPGYGPMPTQPTVSTWANLREAQRQTALADTHAAIAVTVDIGDSADLHPTNKREVGRRLSIAARHLIYGERISPSGPVVDSVRRRGSGVVITFRDVTGALTMRSNIPSGFELCGDTPASCHWADARLEGSAVLLSNAAGATRVRYAWAARRCVPWSTARDCPRARSRSQFVELLTACHIGDP
jgi:Carbohydrate esterase, sialic acid-specific acetylesterase